MTDRRRVSSTPIDPRWLRRIVAYENWGSAPFIALYMYSLCLAANAPTCVCTVPVLVLVPIQITPAPANV